MQYIAQIIASYGRRYIVRTDSQTFEANTRGKRTDFACGDWVKIQQINLKQAVIEGLIPRQSLLYRQDAYKTKLIAANVTQMLIVLAPVPTPSLVLLQRALIAAEAGDIHPVIVLNKSDLDQAESLYHALSPYVDMGYQLLSLSALFDAEVLRPILHGQTNIMLGQSGMGKSTLTNALLGDELARTNEISLALDSGKHTTTHAQLYDLDKETKLIDSPGLQEFGLHHLQAMHLPEYFPDLRHLIGQCRFHNCTHRAEPHCVFKTAAAQGVIDPERLALLQKITNELLR